MPRPNKGRNALMSVSDQISPEQMQEKKAKAGALLALFLGCIGVVDGHGRGRDAPNGLWSINHRVEADIWHHSAVNRR